MNPLLVLLGALALMPASTPLASIRLYNPTAWAGPTVVEVPVGRLASPGQIDWRRVRLVAAGREVPFAVREGRPHWKAALTAPVREPRAEDLLVFSCAAQPAHWLRVDVVPGRPAAGSALRRRSGRLVVSYPGMSVSIDAAAGRLQSMRVGGVEFVRAPLAIDVAAATPREVRPGEFGPGLAHPTYEVVRAMSLPAPRARLVGSSSTPAMTELHFVLDAGPGLALALTYRVHAAGLVEILADERPWSGRSPWMDRAVDVRLSLAGDAEPLPFLANRAPYYGFKEYAAAVRNPAEIRRHRGRALVVLGEETVNGRRWRRRLLAAGPDSATRVRDLAEAADEGLVVDPTPAARPLRPGAVRIGCSPDDRAAADTLAAALRRAGAPAAVATPAGPRDAITLVRGPKPALLGISGDGFVVTPRAAGISIVAGTRFGLAHAAYRVAERLGVEGGRVSVPLIAGNPAVDFRAGGFGGGDFEVDFPYGDEAEWERVLARFVDSGMNVMADLGMWSNWKMPVSYRAMPELRSDAPDAYDEVSGARFAEFDQHRERGLRLLRFLHERGVKVWLWLPIGAVPTTYARQHPEAMSPKSDKIPCFTHPLYSRYLQAFLEELLATYPIDGVVMIRDDNGGICECDRCKAYLAGSRTRSPVWEQYIILYDHLRREGFRGEVAVYPYFDHYQPSLDPLLPRDMRVVGHGAGLGVLSREYERAAPMGDTWLDNLYASFRLPGTPRMRRLLSDRPSFWIGGAYRGTELPWEAVGRFGWEPTATANTFRYEWGRRTFGARGALPFVRFSQACERLWDLFDVPLYPDEWTQRSAAERARVGSESREWLGRFRQRLAGLRAAAGPVEPAWFAQVGLFGRFFEDQLLFLEDYSRMRDLVSGYRGAASGLPPDARARLLALHRGIYRRADALDREAAAVPGAMMARTRAGEMLRPYKQWALGAFGLHEEGDADVRQFGGALSASAPELTAGEPFTLAVELQNLGVCPWMPEPGYRLELSGDASRLGLPARWNLDGAPMVCGDRRVVALRGVAPGEPGEAAVRLQFRPPFHAPQPWLETTVTLRWR